ncbi:MAG TPA: tetratricopeptide repeat protein [Candidatus Hydrogenedentes bacterium]|nr:tetratricopeptide repeat protein [Candidatus Hydrogenedentota bacterium]
MAITIACRKFNSAFLSYCLVFAVFVLLVTGCASTPPIQTKETESRQAWSLRIMPEEMVVAVSPVRQTMQIAGSFATVVGAAITAAQDAQNRNRIEAALGSLNASDLFREAIGKEMTTGRDGSNRIMVPPPQDIRNPQERREADRKRFSALRKQGITEVVDVTLKYGLFGPEGELLAVVQASRIDTRSGRTRFREKWMVWAEPPNAFGPQGDPTRRMTPNITAPRLAAASYAVDRWLVSNAEPLRQGLLRLANGAADALSVGVNEKDIPNGWYILGVDALRRKHYQDARDFLEKAIQGSPDNTDYQLAYAVTLDRLKQRDAAVATVEQALKNHPDQPRLLVNLAWWLASDERRAAEAETLFRRAIELGAPEYSAVRKAIQKAQKAARNR